MAVGLIGPVLLSRKKWEGEPPNPAARDPDDRMDSVFQAGMFGLIALDLVVRFGVDVWHLLQPPG
jgi:hypothetical protein